MRYEITKSVIDFIKKSIGAERGAMANLARKSGLRQPQICSILHGTYKAVQEDTWMRLCSAVPGLYDMGEPSESLGDHQAPIAVATVNGHHSNATAINAAPAVDCSKCPKIDEYRLRVQDRLLGEDDPVPMKTVLQVMREEAGK